MDTMYFESLPSPVDIAQDLQMPQFSLVDYKVIDCSMNYTSGFYSHQLTHVVIVIYLVLAVFDVIIISGILVNLWL